MTHFEINAEYLLPPGEHDAFELSDAIIEACRDIPDILGDPIIGSGAMPRLSVQVYATRQKGINAFADLTHTVLSSVMSALPAGTQTLSGTTSVDPVRGVLRAYLTKDHP